MTLINDIRRSKRSSSILPKRSKRGVGKKMKTSNGYRGKELYGMGGVSGCGKTKYAEEASLLSAMTTNDSHTDNVMVAHSTTGTKLLDFFGVAGSSRGKDITPLFIQAFRENEVLAMKALFWLRDIRGGAGERENFKRIINFMAISGAEYVEAIRRNLDNIVFYGRWDDVLVLINTPLHAEVVSLLKSALIDEHHPLAAKWMPREKSSKKELAQIIIHSLEITPRQYRKLLARLSSTVEQQMCARDWSSIKYSHVPSVASGRYMKAFHRNDGERYRKYIEKVQKGSEKINAGAIYPYDVVKAVKSGDVNLANEQWKALPDYLKGTTRRILPVVDTSGSMDVYSTSGSTSCLDIAVSLGLYLSERNNSIFKDSFITFSRKPALQTVRGTLYDRIVSMKSSKWMMNTDLGKVFLLILDAAIKNNLSAEDMPTDIIILSDMQFDRAAELNGMEMIRAYYNQSGYDTPNIIWWNLSQKSGTSPVKYNEHGAALISGFSPSIMKTIFSSEDFNPYSVMLNTLTNERYNRVS